MIKQTLFVLHLMGALGSEIIVSEPYLGIGSLIHSEILLLTEIVSTREDISNNYNTARQWFMKEYLSGTTGRGSLRRSKKSERTTPNPVLFKLEQLTISQSLTRAVKEFKFSEYLKDFISSTVSESSTYNEILSLEVKARSIARLLEDQVSDMSAFRDYVFSERKSDYSMFSSTCRILKALIDREQTFLNRSQELRDLIISRTEAVLASEKWANEWSADSEESDTVISESEKVGSEVLNNIFEQLPNAIDDQEPHLTRTEKKTSALTRIYDDESDSTRVEDKQSPDNSIPVESEEPDLIRILASFELVEPNPRNSSQVDDDSDVDSEDYDAYK